MKAKPVNKEEAEQFLCSMFGDECELSMAVVRDVLCQCGYNFDKALDALLVLSDSIVSVMEARVYFQFQRVFIISDEKRPVSREKYTLKPDTGCGIIMIRKHKRSGRFFS